MLTEILIKPFIEDLEADKVEDTAPYEIGFKAGMAALSSILSDNIDNLPQLFTYLGMAISEGMQWIESIGPGNNDVAPIFDTHQGGNQPAPEIKFEAPEQEFDFIPSFDTPADFVKKYSKQAVIYKAMDELSKEKTGKMVLDLTQSELILIDDATGNQVKKPYYVRLK